ncbi:MAG: magnesium-translocating P-type ATPase [Candidatus Dadabacteria bacterium RIFCSPHIGHO2_12_FULL_53_21]|nr:MAG: magnesium-translocating P-type ATPase [Candidatus Dadabacteria bacterium RIFCSPHIGHO2_12_FULL_53_21]
MDHHTDEFWSVPESGLLEKLGTSAGGLGTDEALRRLAGNGRNILKPSVETEWLPILLSQFKSPIIIILLFAAVLSLFLSSPADAIIILAIVFVSGLLGFWQEHGAANAVKNLLNMVRIKAAVLRDGTTAEVPIEDIVPGDVVLLSAGGIIPGDCRILDSKDLFVNEATLTGETYPAEKLAGVLPAGTPLRKRTNTLFMGTSVVSGSGRAVIVHTGKETLFGGISEKLKLRPPETEFQHGVRRFGYFLMEVTLILVIAIFAVNVYFERPVLDSFLFSLAIAVGLTPQLLPAIISINLARGAKRMALESVIVKRLSSIENFGSMNVLCSDKTGTLTRGEVRLHSAEDVSGRESEDVLFHAYLNAYFETGFRNPIDEAIRAHSKFDIEGYKKLDEVPYDFSRKRLSILLSKEGANLMVTKGALINVLSVCTHARVSGGGTEDIESVRGKIEERFANLSREGFRVLGVAIRSGIGESLITKDFEKDMTFLGFITLFDPPKEGVRDTIDELERLGIELKVVTGDSREVALYVSREVGLPDPQAVTGKELLVMSNDALLKMVSHYNVFAEVEPSQKERIINAMKKAGNVVGYMGDGINDASALHAADVGISVESAVDVAKQAADIVLLKMDLGVLVNGVREGRVTFANTLKYVFMATSANFGNMFSMAGASLFLSFLPLLPKQILLTNLMTDLPEMTIAGDSVDREMAEKPRRWDIRFIRNFMATFGLISSIFDYMTFGVLLFIFHATTDQFRTGWFIESVISATLIILVIRTRGPFLRSRPGKYLALAVFLVICATLFLPYSRLAHLFGFHPLPPSFLIALGVIVVLYVITAEVAKKIFYKRVRG